MSYEQALRRKVIREFARENERAPTRAEILDKIQKLKTIHVNIENKGISGIDLKGPAFLSESSVALERKNRLAISDDLYALHERVSAISEQLEDDYRSFRVQAAQLRKRASWIEGQVNETLLAFSAEDAFTSYYREDFTEPPFFEPSANVTAYLEDGVVIAARNQVEKIELRTADITFSPLSNARVLSQAPSNPASSVLSLDGRTFEYQVLTDQQNAVVDLVVTINLQTAEDIGEIRVSSLPIRRTAQETVSAFYSVDGVDYQLIEPGMRSFDKENTLISVGQDGVKSIRLVFTKSAADSRTTSFGQWAYLWSFDSIELYRTSFGFNQTYVWQQQCDLQSSAAFTEVNAISKVTLEVCTIEPKDTSISWYVSSDQENWVPINPYRKAIDIVTLNVPSFDNQATFQGSLEAADLVNPRNYGAGNVTDEDEWMFNTYFVNLDQEDLPNDSSLSCCLDVADPDVPDSGWRLNSKNNYETWLYVSSPTGKEIDLGPKPARLDGRPVSGKVFLRSGWSRFETSADNFQNVSSGAPDENVLRTIDPLYPFNHKYVVEGYVYGEGFEGPRLYTGVDDWCGMVLQYKEPDVFEDDEDEQELWTWHPESFPGLGTIILVKVDPTESTLLTRKNSFVWTGQPKIPSLWTPGVSGPDEGDADQVVYVRALLETSSEGLTPIIDWFVIRGI